MWSYRLSFTVRRVLAEHISPFFCLPVFTLPKMKRARWMDFATIALFSSLLCTLLWHSQQPILRSVDNLLFDFYFRARGPVPPAEIEKLPQTRDIVVVQSTHQLPRPLLAKLIDKLRLARVVALDFMLVDDQKNFAPDEARWYQSEIKRWKTETEVLTRAVQKHGRVILVAWPEENSTLNLQPLATAPQISTQNSTHLVWRHPPDALWRAAGAHCHPIIQSQGGVARRVNLLQNIAPSGKIPQNVPCMGLALAALSQHQTPAQWLRAHPEISTDAPIMLNWLGSRETFGQLSNSIGYTQVLDLWEAEDFKDKIVIIGEVSRQSKEIVLTPFGETPALQAHATVLATLLDPRGPPRNSTSLQLFFLSLVGSSLLMLPLLRWPLWISFVWTGLLILGFIIGGAWLFSARHLVLEGSAPIASCLLTLNCIALYEYWRTRNTLGRFIGSEMLKRVLHPLEQLKVGGREEIATAMFCDLRGYSTLSEAIAPAQATQLLNAYVTLLLRVITKHGGRAIDYQGDGVFILFESDLAGTDHAQGAVRAALEIADEFRAFNRIWRDIVHSELEVGIGLECGPMLIGVLGSQDRIHLGAVGDAVNVAARVQALSKTLGSTILITENVRERLGDEFRLQEHGEHLVKGRSQSVQLFSVCE